MRRLLPLAALLVALAACGTGTSGGESPAPGEPAEATPTDLVISVTPDAGAAPRELSLTCDPPGGDHPNAAAACDRLAQAGSQVFEPVPADRACTEIFGGPQTATITGVYDGTAVDASFSRENGCEIDRWDTLGTEVFDVPLQ
jgi:hypothetical protein